MKSLFLLPALTLSAAAIAQGPQTPPAPAAGNDAAVARHRQDEARDLATVLALTPAQQPALQSWLAAMRPPEGLWRHDRGGADDARPKTTPEMLQDKQTRLAAMQKFQATRLAATRSFYGALDTRQQQVFDALGRLRHEHHGFRGGRGGPDMPPPSPPVAG